MPWINKRLHVLFAICYRYIYHLIYSLSCHVFRLRLLQDNLGFISLSDYKLFRYQLLIFIVHLPWIRHYTDTFLVAMVTHLSGTLDMRAILGKLWIALWVCWVWGFVETNAWGCVTDCFNIIKLEEAEESAWK